MKKSLSLLFILALGLLLLLQPERASDAAREGLALCAGTVIPSLFPFMAVVSMLLQLGLADSLQGFCAPFMGPLFRMRGVCALPELYRQGRLSRQEAELLLGFCDNCGPAFLLGFAGTGILGSARAGVWLYLVHVGSALLTGMVLCRLQRDRGAPLLAGRSIASPVSFPQALTSAVAGSAGAMVNICAFVVLFRVLAALPPVPLLFPALGALEMVSAAAALPEGRWAFPAAAALTGWGGLSVHCQAMSVAGSAGLSFRWHWLGKAVQAAVSFLLAAGVQYALSIGL